MFWSLTALSFAEGVSLHLLVRLILIFYMWFKNFLPVEEVAALLIELHLIDAVTILTS